MKSLIVSSADYSSERVAVPEAKLPPVGRALKHILIADKFNAATGILQDPIAGDFQHSAFVVNGEKPVTSNPVALGNKLCLSFAREAGKRKDLKGALNCENSVWTMTFVHANSNSIATNTNRVLFSFLSKLEDSKQTIMRYYSTGSSGVTRLLMGQSAGALLFGNSSNVTTVNHNLGLASTNAVKTVISLVGNVDTQQIKVYTNAVLTETLASSYVTPLKGDLYLGVSLTIADETGDYWGSIGEVVIHDDELTAAEIAKLHAALSAAFTA